MAFRKEGAGGGKGRMDRFSLPRYNLAGRSGRKISRRSRRAMVAYKIKHALFDMF